ncbi:glyoxylate/hydroxypyruvate reductase HPR3 [Lolium perenne]|uniref:glyoxylate/hydroxypyruvate reductase HPR3 n=1 Tax=Lolium perenne TaxID=4522 RepID=UPI0021F56675|nr:glyoxylate/hydroxypyruvate reductase HPR3-like [Lolium perenne]
MRPPPPPSDERPLVLLAQPLFPDFAAALASRFRFALAADADAADAAEGRVLLVGLKPVTDEHLAGLPALELVAGISVGVDHVDLAACRRRGLSVTNAGAAFAVDSADYAVGLLIAVLRQVAAADAYVRGGRWPADGDYPLTTKVSGKRVGIVGLGNIGSRVARRLAAFGCAVSYHSRSPKPSSPYTFVPTLLDLAVGSDVLVLSCALTDETKHMANREVMEALGKDGVLINVGRGGLVDEPELVSCLRDGALGGAGLDVYANEPAVPPELFGMDNVVLSDHRAVITPESMRGVLEVITANLDAFFSGRPLVSPVQL